MIKMLKMLKLHVFSRKNGQNDVTQAKLFIMTLKSLLEVQNTNNSEFWMLLNIILSDFQQYRTLLAKVIQFFVSRKCKNQRYNFLTPDR